MPRIPDDSAAPRSFVVPPLAVAAPRAFAALVTRPLRYTLSEPATFFGELLGVFLLAVMFLVIVPTRGFAPGGWTAAEWLVPGLLAIVAWHSAFTNAAFSVVFHRLEGGMDDMLTAPIPSLILAAGWAFGSTLNALLVALAAGLILSLFAPPPVHIVAVVLWLGVGALTLSFAGIVAGLYSPRYDTVSFYDTLFVYPILMLSGFLGTGAPLPMLGRVLVDGNPLSQPVRALRAAWHARPLEGTARGEIFLLFALAIGWIAAWSVIARGRQLRR
ncbi:MAG: ABC transporter permease [Alphaproteobacteria bacterium]|nr:ABC transporter permease [Alphaproteobacteria bacterium]MDA7983442.1 ABC transporter permease [Alphaproteobacteria bacterium]MDA7984990.1 ABC transporter permease [Alphaproteobacteria bacterium]MDA7987852.1 ABC transporter permease [Alphaproteobacteria bacterium]MDA7988995.1 ABC transporter permease [Alphaproteobacteria bacterium]